jgi:hypothetical protein
MEVPPNMEARTIGSSYLLFCLLIKPFDIRPDSNLLLFRRFGKGIAQVSGRHALKNIRRCKCKKKSPMVKLEKKI